jgi:hypothetical protein
MQESSNPPLRIKGQLAVAYPFAEMPTLRQFIDAAVMEDCREGYSKSELVGPRGPTRARYLVGTNRVLVILPNIADHERLTPNQTESMTRALQIQKFPYLL